MHACIAAPLHTHLHTSRPTWHPAAAPTRHPCAPAETADCMSPTAAARGRGAHHRGARWAISASSPPRDMQSRRRTAQRVASGPGSPGQPPARLHRRHSIRRSCTQQACSFIKRKKERLNSSGVCFYYCQKKKQKQKQTNSRPPCLRRHLHCPLCRVLGIKAVQHGRPGRGRVQHLHLRHGGRSRQAGGWASGKHRDQAVVLWDTCN